MNIKQTNSNVAKEILNKCGQKPGFLKQDRNERVTQLHKLSTSWVDNQRDFWDISCPADITFQKTFLKKVWNISRKLRYVLKTHERDWNLQPKMSPRKWPRTLQWKKSMMRVAQIMGKSKSWRDLCLSNTENRTHALLLHAWNRDDRAAGLIQVAQNIKQRIPSKSDSPALWWEQHFFQRNCHWPPYHQGCDRSDHRKWVIKMIKMLIVSDWSRWVLSSIIMTLPWWGFWAA